MKLGIGDDDQFCPVIDVRIQTKTPPQGGVRLGDSKVANHLILSSSKDEVLSGMLTSSSG